MTDKKWSIGIVIPWFAKDISGGAEQQAWQIAYRMAQQGWKITVLTTCSRSFLHSWDKNYYKEGSYKEDGICIKRFPVDKRNSSQFNKIVGKLLSFSKTDFIPGRPLLSKKEEQIYWKNNINSSALIDYLTAEHETYSAFIFLPYLFPTSYFGIQAIKNKSLLQVCLHDECYAYLKGTMQAIHQCKALFFNSHGEYKLAQKIYGPWIKEKSYIIGEGIEHFSSKKNLGKSLFKIANPFFLCLGRKCQEKNTNLILEAFKKFKEKCKHPVELIFAGPEPLSSSFDAPGVQDLGLVSPEGKHELLKNCLALINPSENESFSRVIFEAWHYKKPVLIHSHCLATFTALQDSGYAGWSAKNLDEFSQTLEFIVNSPQKRLIELGQKGFEYSKEIADWDQVIKRYDNSFAKLFPTLKRETRHLEVLFINPYLEEQQSVQQDLLFMTNTLINSGYTVKILSHNPSSLPPDSSVKSLSWQQLKEFTGSLLIWLGNEKWEAAEKHLKDLKCLKILRIIEPNAKVGDFANIFDFQLQGFPLPKQEVPDQIPLIPLFSPHLIKKGDYVDSEFKKYNDFYYNVLVFIDLEKSSSTSDLETLIENFYEKYNKSLRLFIPMAMTKHINLKKDLDDICKIEAIKSASHSLPSYIYQTCDCVLIVNEPSTPTWQIINTSIHQTPILCLSSPAWANYLKLPSQFFFSKNVIENLISTMKVVGQNGENRAAYLETTKTILMNYIPGVQENAFLHKIDSFHLRESKI